MRRFQALVLVLAFLLCSVPAVAASPNGEIVLGLDEGGTGRYTNVSVSLAQVELDGSLLEGDMPAFIWGGRTMVPVRLIAESLGALVHWLPDTNEVHISHQEIEIRLKIGSAQATVNGETAMLYDGVPAMVAKHQGMERTMVPLRFVSEHLEAQVGWKQESYTAVISTGTALYQVLDLQWDSGAKAVHISASMQPEYAVTDLGDRVVVDLLRAELSTDTAGTIPGDGKSIFQVRYAQHGAGLYEEYTSVVRIVLDLADGISFSQHVELELLSNGLRLTVDPDRKEPPFVPTTPVNPDKKTVVLDAGHGGSATGAVYEGILEKDINLAVTRKVQTILKDYGYRVIMTRTGDTTIGLYARAEIANAANADIFVSIHANAAERNSEFTGIYTFYHPTSAAGAKLAQSIQTPLCRLTGAIDRGIESADFVVLRATKMSAVLVELGFMTNSGELHKLTDPAYQDKLAFGIAEGIVVYLNGR